MCYLSGLIFFVALYFKHHELAAGTDAEGWAPEGEALRYVDVGVRPAAIAVALLEELVGDPRQWPHLATMSVSAEEQVYTQGIGFGHAVGLMVEHEGAVQFADGRIVAFSQNYDGASERYVFSKYRASEAESN